MKFLLFYLSVLCTFGLNASQFELPELGEPEYVDLCVNKCMNLPEGSGFGENPALRIFELSLEISGATESNATLVAIGNSRSDFLDYSSILFEIGVSQTNLYLRCNKLKEIYTSPAPATSDITIRLKIRQSADGVPRYVKFYCNGEELLFEGLNLTEGIPEWFSPSSFKSLKFTRRGLFEGEPPTGKVVASADGIHLIIR